jgi:hypothetical protein
MHAGIPSCYRDNISKMQEMLVGLQVAVMLLSIWNLILVTGDWFHIDNITATCNPTNISCILDILSM